MSVEAGLLRSRVAQTSLAALWPLLFVGIVVGLGAVAVPALIASLPLVLIGGIFLAIKRAMAARPVVARGRVKLRDGVVHLDAQPLAKRAEITSGVVVAGAAEGVVVRLERRRRSPIELHVADVDRARDVLRSLQLDPARAVARFRVLAADAAAWKRRMQGMTAALVLFGASIAITARSGMPILIPLHVLLILTITLWMIIPARVTVGSDGISIHRLGRDEFIALEGIVDAIAGDSEPTLNGTLSVVRLLDAEGRVVRELVVDQKKKGPFTEGIHLAIDARARSLADRIRETIRLRNARKEPFDPRTLRAGIAIRARGFRIFARSCRRRPAFAMWTPPRRRLCSHSSRTRPRLRWIARPPPSRSRAPTSRSKSACVSSPKRPPRRSCASLSRPPRSTTNKRLRARSTRSNALAVVDRSELPRRELRSG